ncbi:MAG: hypothetical protein R2707_07280 [Acidimicrobiales bacterium]
MKRRLLISLASIALLLTSCADDATTTSPIGTSTTSTPATTSPPTTPTSSSPTTPPTTPTTTTTTVPAPLCDPSGPLAVIEGALATARLAVPTGWDTDPTDTSFAERTATGELYAERLGLDCGLLLAADDTTGQWLVVAAWTGRRAAFAVQTTARPSEPFRAQAVVRLPVGDLTGEYLSDDMSLWGVSGADDESIVIGHADYSFGPAAKDWDSGTRDFFEPEISVPAEQHALDALEAAGMRNVGIAQPTEVGSEEGYAQFISTTGQISVADVAPTGWFDPMTPRYYTGETSIETIGGVDVRVTLPKPDDNLGFVQAAEVAFACDDYVWLLEPPFNGTADEMVASAAAVIGTEECRG